MHKFIEKIQELTTIVEVDENGVEHEYPWTLKEFLMGHLVIMAGVIIGMGIYMFFAGA